MTVLGLSFSHSEAQQESQNTLGEELEKTTRESREFDPVFSVPLGVFAMIVVVAVLVG